MVTFLVMVTNIGMVNIQEIATFFEKVLWIVTILGMVTITRDADHPICGGFLRDFYHPQGWLLSFGPKES